MPKLIIFDLDGTLVDTEAPSGIAFYDVLQTLGTPPSFDIIEPEIHARSLKDSAEIVRCHDGLKHLTNDQILDTYYEVYKPYLMKVGDAIAIPYARDVMASLSKNIPVTVGTNGEVELSDIKLRNCGFFEAMPDLKIHTKDLVARPKPAPDLFLYIADKYGVLPTETLVIEDSVTGVTAAVAAGMNVFGFTGVALDKTETEAALRHAGAMFIFDDYRNFPAFAQAEKIAS